MSFIIKDFYKSVKFANIYDRAYEDYKSGSITHDGFQRLATVEIYSGRFNHTWMYWFLIQPILSSALGIIAFFIARSGLGVISGTSTDPDLSIRSLYMYAVFTFLAGFSSHKFIAWLDRLADKIFSTTLPEEKAAKKMEVESAAVGDRQNLRDELVGLGTVEVPKPKAAPASDPAPAADAAEKPDAPEVPATDAPKKAADSPKPMKQIR